MEGIVQNFSNRFRRGHAVRETANWDRLSASAGTFNLLPATQKLHKYVSAVTLVKQLREEVQVGNQRGLEDDRNVRGVEQLDGVGALLTTVLLVLDWEIHTEALEVDDDD